MPETKDGYCNLPRLAGLGIEIDEAEVKRRHVLAYEAGAK